MAVAAKEVITKVTVHYSGESQVYIYSDSPPDSHDASGKKKIHQDV